MKSKKCECCKKEFFGQNKKFCSKECYTYIEKNKAVVLLRKAGMPMKEIVRAFGKTDKRNFYRIWHRDKNKYFIPVLFER